MSEKILFVDDEPAILDGYDACCVENTRLILANGSMVALEMLDNKSMPW